jgi:hypothetical protein
MFVEEMVNHILLALDQVLENLGHALTIFGTSTGWSKAEHKAKRISWDLSHFLGHFGFRVYVTGMGCRPMGLPMFRPHLQCINRYLGDVRK